MGVATAADFHAHPILKPFPSHPPPFRPLLPPISHSTRPPSLSTSRRVPPTACRLPCLVLLVHDLELTKNGENETAGRHGAHARVSQKKLISRPYRRARVRDPDVRRAVAPPLGLAGEDDVPEGGARARPRRAECALLERVPAPDAVDGRRREVELVQRREGAQHGREAGEEALERSIRHTAGEERGDEALTDVCRRRKREKKGKDLRFRRGQSGACAGGRA